MTQQKTVLVVTGPTASGKSALALAFAQMRGGCVINADAMQTYDAFPMLTAQPTAEERARVPHALYGVLPLRQNLSAGRWSVMAAAEIERCLAAGQMPILCGGSGLYIRTLMQGLSPVPDVPAEIRERGNAEWASMGAEAFRARLAERDPEIVAGLKPADRQRHVRAWEVLEATGTPLSAWQKEEGMPAPWRFAILLLAPERPWLRARIELRFDQMLAAGVLAEARAVFDARPDPTWLGLKAHGAPEFFRHFNGELSIDHARRMAIDHTRQYAKRQMTWFRHQMTPDLVFNPTANPDLGAPEKLLDKIGV
jgi:tRNA dimethylallyltransferase